VGRQSGSECHTHCLRDPEPPITLTASLVSFTLISRIRIPSLLLVMEPVRMLAPGAEPSA
jgi:hypothetical protein